IDADVPRYYADGCHAIPRETVPAVPCSYGDPQGALHVALLGDSKIGQWFAPLEAIALREGWRLTVHTKSSCPYVPGRTFLDYPNCTTFNAAVRAIVEADPPDIVITS